MTADNKTLMHRWFDEVWNQGRAETIDELMAEDCVIHGLADASGKDVRGKADFRAFHAQFREAFPEIVVTVEETIAEGDLLAARCSVRGKHAGDSLGFKATQAPVEFTGIAIVRVENGKFVEVWNNFDFLTMYQQLGHQLQKSEDGK
jgi:steroid delta-isomerase-like uncharacterized protein